MDISVWQDGTMSEGLGAAIRTRREAHGWTQEQLSEASGLNVGTISRIERGANTSVDALLKIARALGAELVVTLEDETSKLAVRDAAVAGAPSSDRSPVDSAPTPGKDPILVPTPLHRALYTTLAGLPAEQIGDLATTATTRLVKFHANVAREAKTEGDVAARH